MVCKDRVIYRVLVICQYGLELVVLHTLPEPTINVRSEALENSLAVVCFFLSWIALRYVGVGANERTHIYEVSPICGGWQHNCRSDKGWVEVTRTRFMER